MNSVLPAEMSSRVYYELAPLLPVSEWWHFLLLLLALLAGLAFVVFMYRLDSVELPRPLAILLTLLRVSAISGLVFFFLNLEKRSEQRIVRNSRVAMLIDTSSSMGLSSATSAAETSGSVSRADEVNEWLTNSQVLNDLRSRHDVTVYTFSDSKRATEVASFSRMANIREDASEADAAQSPGQVRRSELASFATARSLFAFGASLLAIAVLLNVVSGLSRWLFAKSSAGTWMFATGVLTLVAAVVMIAASDVACVSASLAQTAGFREFDGTATLADDSVETQSEEAENQNGNKGVVWSEFVKAEGTETFLNDALKGVINKERDGPIAGVLVVSDGRNTSGSTTRFSVAAAREATVPLFTIGAGSNESPRNLRVVDVKAPTRVFPGDNFKVTAMIQAFGFHGQEVSVELYSVDEDETEAESLEANGTYTVPIDSKPEPITFELQQQNEGVRVYRVKIKPLPGETQLSDNEESARIEFIDRKQHVLIVAGGPMRDYRFLRNFLFRDTRFISHVYLQTAAEGADQEADETLYEFPKTREAWFELDCIVAFDPNWELLSSQQAKWLDQWISEKAGGLIVIAGPVNTPGWTRRPRGDETIDVIRRLYPVAFYNQATSVVKLGRFGGERSFPLEFTRSGRAAEFLWLAETSSASQSVWSDSQGVFGYYAVSEPKPGAEIFARFSDQQTRIAGNLPIYLAAQFYGAGRVYFQASGEMWRMRSLDPTYFEQYYSRLIRWVSQGRLSRDSDRGLLLVDKDKVWVGDRVTVQAILRDAQDRPLALPAVDATISTPAGIQNLELKRIDDGTNGGTYTTQFTAAKEGKYRISLPVPESPDAEVLSKTVVATMSDIEIGQPERNDAVLQEMADLTGGRYFTGVDRVPVSIVDSVGNNLNGTVEHLGKLITSRDQETFLPGTTDREFTRRCMMWLLGVFVMVLALEWTIRRLNRLA